MRSKNVFRFILVVVGAISAFVALNVALGGLDTSLGEAAIVMARVALNVGWFTSSSLGSERETSVGVAPHVSCHGRTYRA